MKHSLVELLLSECHKTLQISSIFTLICAMMIKADRQNLSIYVLFEIKMLCEQDLFEQMWSHNSKHWQCFSIWEMLYVIVMDFSWSIQLYKNMCPKMTLCVQTAIDTANKISLWVFFIPLTIFWWLYSLGLSYKLLWFLRTPILVICAWKKRCFMSSLCAWVYWQACQEFLFFYLFIVWQGIVSHESFQTRYSIFIFKQS